MIPVGAVSARVEFLVPELEVVSLCVVFCVCSVVCSVPRHKIDGSVLKKGMEEYLWVSGKSLEHHWSCNRGIRSPSCRALAVC